MSVEDAWPALPCAALIRIFPRMDGDRTWRVAGISGVRAMYSGGLPYTLENMAARIPLVMSMKPDAAFTRCAG